MSWPTDPAERALIRSTSQRADGTQVSLTYSLGITCGVYNLHAPRCADDGTGCLCECHDRTPTDGSQT